LAYGAGVDFIVSYDEAVRDAAVALGFEVFSPKTYSKCCAGITNAEIRRPY
jgi:hypothetical protein